MHALDIHPGLGTLSSATADESYSQALSEDAREQSRAYAFMSHLSDEEMSSRVAIADATAPWDPKERYDWDPPQECTVCGHLALVVERTDDLGYGIGSGTCAVCSYRRSEAIMDEMAMNQE